MKSHHLLITKREAEFCIFLLSSNEPVLIKRGLQFIFWEYEKGRLLTREYRSRIIPLVLKFNKHPNTKVRRWFYITVSILKPPDYYNILSELIANYEDDHENLSWACAAIYSLLGENDTKQFFKKNDSLISSKQLELSSLLFSKSNSTIISSRSKLYDIMNANDPLLTQWLILLYGYSNTSLLNKNFYEIDKDIIQDLTSHDNPMIAEYAIWSLFYKPSGSFLDLKKPIIDLVKAPQNVRRWLYQLVGKDDDSILINSDFLLEQIDKENDVNALEGLSKALSDKYVEGIFAEKLVKWYLNEENQAIRIQLLRHFISFSDINEDYLEIVEEELTKNPSFINNIMMGLAIKRVNKSISSHLINDARYIINNTIYLNIGGTMSIDNRKIEISNVKADGMAFNFGNISAGDISISEIKNNRFISAQYKDEIVKNVDELSDIALKIDITDELKTELKNHIKELVKDISKADEKSAPIVKSKVDTIRNFFSKLPSKLPLITQGLSIIEKINDVIGKIF